MQATVTDRPTNRDHFGRPVRKFNAGPETADTARDMLGAAGRKFDARYKTDTHSDPFARLVRNLDAGMEMTAICWMVVRDTYPLDPENVALGSCNLGQYVKMNCWPYLMGRCFSRVPGDQRNNRVQSLCKEESANMYAESTTS